MNDAISYDNVLVPTDGSEAAEASLAHAMTIARDHGCSIHALYVIDQRMTMAAEADTRERLLESMEREGQQALETIADRLERAGLKSESAMREGTPAKEILAYAADVGIDLIVIANSGKSPREKRLAMGSVSERVVEESSLPVLVIKAPDVS